MTVYENESVFPVDIDGTLIYWTKVKKKHKVIAYTCPYTLEQKIVGVNEPNVAVLRERLARGCIVLVWSKTGNAKAHAVLKALGIDHKNLIVIAVMASKSKNFKGYKDCMLKQCAGCENHTYGKIALPVYCMECKPLEKNAKKVLTVIAGSGKLNK